MNELPRVRVAPPGPRSLEMASRQARYESPAFDARRHARELASGEVQAPVVYAEARGSNVVDVDGNMYVDLVAGFGAVSLGHRHQAVDDAVRRAMGTLPMALGDVYPSAPKIDLMERLARLLPEPNARVMLGLSGADAVTAAMKTAVLHTGRPGVVAFHGSYHGLSHAPLAACGLKDGFRAPFAGQLNPHVTFVPYPRDAAAVDACMMQVIVAMSRGTIGAVLIEPFLGRGGVIPAPPAFLERLRAACDAVGALLIVDEIWTGLGRSGAMLVTSEAGVVPDLLCVGKGLGGGLPISACVGRGDVMRAWGAHGGEAIHTATHFGTPPACMAAIAVLDTLEREKIPERVRDVGAQWKRSIEQATAGRGVREVRGRGLMLGVEVDGGAARALTVMRKLLARGWLVLTGGADGATLTLTPPLTITETLLEAFVPELASALSS